MLPTLLLCAFLPVAESASFRYEPSADQTTLSECYRLASRSIEYRLLKLHELPASGIEVHRLTFASPVTCACTENNTVHAEYYRPHGAGPFPGVVVLDIMAGDGTVSRSFATYLAQNQVAALYVHMAYYGPRRPAGSRLRMISTDVPRTLAAVQQSVLDVRVAGAWLASRSEIDSTRLGIMGTSLGSFIATLSAETEPRFQRLAVLLGGGGLVDTYYEHPRADSFRRTYELAGGSKGKLKEVLAPVDPLTLAGNLRGRSVLMLCAGRDEIVPPTAAKALWEAAGKPSIRWFDTTHYGAALYIPTILPDLVQHFSQK